MMMKYLPIFLFTVLLSCTEETSPFPVKEHDALKKELVSNYHAHRSAMQEVAAEVSKFRIIRAIDFVYAGGRNKGIHVYCDSIDRNGEGKAFTVKDLNDPQLVSALKAEGITLDKLKTLKEKLKGFGCNSFFSLRVPDTNTGEAYIQTEFRYDTWNGTNFYYYKIFDKKLDSGMTAFFNTHLVNINEGTWKNKGGIIDSNAIWYYKND